ncbi:hypothetical protein RU93_GL001213 [Enterococcus aquimarinus]|jgi:hypothetical protein|uniref:Uncharacterized protein n=2 Tax=Enterococcus aquimarinus TaxID=328396 RepID=A0A1L8QNR1_9ENTE|nr:hypothetical protein RU93_GL001213 [Enterococcus aquimarinus]
MVQKMKKRMRKKKAYKQYIHDIFTGYEQMLSNPDLNELRFTYLKEETVLKRDEENQIRFRTYDLD